MNGGFAGHTGLVESRGQVRALEEKLKADVNSAREILGKIRQAFAALQQMGKEVYMITGDNQQTARAIAGQL